MLCLKQPEKRHRVQARALPASRSPGVQSPSKPRSLAKFKPRAPKAVRSSPAQKSKTPPFLPPLEPSIWKPVPVAQEEVDQALLVDGGSPLELRQIAEKVWAGQSACFTRRWKDLLEVRKALNVVATERLASLQDAAEAHRERRRLLRNCARRLFAEVSSSGELQPAGGPPLGYVPVLYEDAAKLYFRANDITALNVAWQFFLNGLEYSFLPNKLHPFFGVYFTLSPVEPWQQTRRSLLSSRVA